jgi:exodeoxyribonuclease-3
MSEPRTLRIVSWNVESLTPLLGISASRNSNVATPSLHDVFDAFGRPDVLCLQEVRIRPQDPPAIEAMTRALPSHGCGSSLCSDPINAKFRGGRTYGVVSYVARELQPLWLPRPSWDREGRLVAFALPQYKVVIANLYAVNGTDKPYFDHDKDQYDRDRHVFKRTFQALLLDHFAAIHREGFELLLIGDWNVARTAADVTPRLRTEPPHAAARRMLNDEFIPSLDVVDVFRELHPDARSYTWFNRFARGRQLDAARVDYALLSRSLLPCVIDAAIDERPAQRFHSDHAPLTVSVALASAREEHAGPHQP